MAVPAAFRITYARYAELRTDVEQQMTRGGLLVRVSDTSALVLDMPVSLELVLPDGTSLREDTKVLQVLAGLGVAVSVGAKLIEQAKRATGRDAANAAPAQHLRLDRLPVSATPPPAPVAASAPPPAAPPRAPVETKPFEALSNPEKIQKALHGTRDDRNAVLRDRNRMLHAYVLKNPQITLEDVTAIAKNATMGPDVLKQIAERKEWFQRPAIALALARNPKTPPEVAVKALDYAPIDAVRQMAKGTGVMPHVVQAARKKILGK